MNVLAQATYGTLEPVALKASEEEQRARVREDLPLLLALFTGLLVVCIWLQVRKWPKAQRPR